jgi:crotonobetainyl-CoA:carnitine CoA-transferase CaiB-like acyl-CoA transferase
LADLREKLESSETELQEAREEVTKQHNSCQVFEVKNATLTATNAGLTSAHASLTATNTELGLTIAALHKQVANSMSLQVFREVHKAAASPVIEAIHAVNGSSAPVPVPDGPPRSHEDVVAFFNRLGWSSDEIQQFQTEGVTGEVLLNDINVAMCHAFGVSALHILTLTRRLQKWNPAWG